MISTRPAVADDRNQLFTLIDNMTVFTYEDKEMAREVIYDGLASKENGYHILVAFDSNNFLAGFICYGLIPMTMNRWDLYWIAVTPELSRTGVGSLLLKAMEERLGKGARIYIDTSSTSSYAKAHSFYERHGYEMACILSDFYRKGDDKIIYHKDLRSI